MTHRTATLWALGVMQLLAIAVAFAAMEAGWADNDWFRIACVPILYVQPYVAGIWIGFGEKSLPWRMLGVAAFLTCLTWVSLKHFFSLPGAVLELSPGIAVALAFMLLARAFGYRLREENAESPGDGSARFQFTVRSLLKWTAVTAMLFSLAALVNPGATQTGVGPLWQMALALLVFHVPLAAILFVEFTILLGMRRPWIGFALFVPVVLGGISPLGWNSGVVTELLLGASLLMAWFALCFLPLRLFGYRFGRCRSQPQEETIE